MLSAVLFAPDKVAARRIEQAALDSKEVCIYKTMHSMVSPYELTGLLNCFRPDIVFLELREFEKALVLARHSRLIYPEAAVIGFAQPGDEECAQQAIQAGVLEILPSPLTDQKFQQGVEQAMRKARPGAQENLLAFLPGKAGGGATTIALNVAGSLANDRAQRVLLMEADLRSGVLSVLLKLSADHSILDALENAARLDGTLWSRIVTKAAGLDVLTAPMPVEGVAVSWTNYHQLLQFIRPRYDTIVVDLPELINDASVEIVSRARAVFVVTTPELPSLVLARQRRHELRNRGIADDRVFVLLNRWTRNESQRQELEQFLESPVFAAFPNDYQRVRRAMQEGRLVSGKSELGRAFCAFASRVAGVEATARPPKSKLVLFDSLVQGKTCEAH